MIKSLPWNHPPAEYAFERSLRLGAASALRGVSAMLTRLARRIASAEVRSQRKAVADHLEFYAEAGAPEGALYADGVLIGYLSGVKRL